MIKIISSHSNEGGSTEAFINLTNLFNQAGYSCTYYGPGTYHLGKCQGIQIPGLKERSKFNFIQKIVSIFSGKKKPSFPPAWHHVLNLLNEEDVVIIHNIKNIPHRPNVKRFILSCHEQHVFPLKNEDLSVFDNIHFVSEHQKDWHNIQNTPHFIMGNIYPNLSPKLPALTKKIGAVIGAIHHKKCTIAAIKWALKDNCIHVKVYGNKADTAYFNLLNTVFEQEIKDGIVRLCGHISNKQVMYDSFTDLYHCSEHECLPNVIGEALVTGKKIHIPNDRNYKDAIYLYDKKTVLKTWITHLGLD